MRRLRSAAALLVAAAAAAALPAAASAQVSFFGGNGAQPSSAVLSNVKATGAVGVDFHGDEASGCAETHLCGVSGRITWDPGRGGSLVAFGYRSHGQHFEDGFFGIGDELGFGGTAVTSARVRRATGDGSPAKLCADVGPSISVVGGGPRHGSSIAVSLLGGEVLRTRCAGPLSGDVRSLLPTRVISERALRRGGSRLDFSADGEFAAHGLAGTLHSDVVLRVAKGSDLLHNSDQQPPGGTRRLRQRFLQVSYRVERVAGRLVTDVHGLTDPDLCGPLDSCGLMGTVTGNPTASSGDGFLVAYGSAKHTVWELKRALGLAPGPRPRGVTRFGSFSWTDDSGSVTADLNRDGAPACADALPLAGGGFIDLQFSGAHIGTGYFGGDPIAGGDPLQTRCPGPDAADVESAGGLARGTLPLRALAQRRVTLRLTHGSAFSSDGYSGSTRADLTVVVRRTRVRQQVVVDHVPLLRRKLLRRLP